MTIPTFSDPGPGLAGRYVLGELIGRGGMADVHRATDTVLDRQVAVKLLRQDTTSHVDRARFTTEATTVAALTHPHIVMLLDAGLDRDHPFLVMELVEGGSLADRLDGTGWPPQRVAVLGQQVAEALALAHGQGIVHRDVKPANVLITPDGTAKLADFGIARLVASSGVHTLPGHSVGTPTYLAPEQLTGAEISARADVYSLGLVLLEMLTGRKSFDGTAAEVAFARLGSAPTVPTDLPAGWAGLLTRMTASEPERRPDAAESARGLAALARGEVPELDPVETVDWSITPGGETQVLRTRPRRRRAAVAGLAALLVTSALVVAFGAGARNEAPPEPPPIPPGVPEELVEPLEDLQDAVYGRTS
ncbi:serine/threonine-protein kinase [Nocardioides limicola]|uniref:serine/threonine-protein kinase n=1 Tax=Nocardioides limicola TaxID=2803368 RepID=UPI00193B2B6B|nr:serine/threonine-protein kinase [Nocardioides sp. DJM-14]